MIYLITKFHMPSSRSALVITTEPKAKDSFFHGHYAVALHLTKELH
jgi:hypothetical protein